MAHKVRLSCELSKEELDYLRKGQFPKRLLSLCKFTQTLQSGSDLQVVLLKYFEPAVMEGEGVFMNSSEIADYIVKAEELQELTCESVGRSLTLLGFGFKMARSEKKGQIKKLYCVKFLTV